MDIIKINPIYNKLFTSSEITDNKKWDSLKSDEKEIISPSQVDFSISSVKENTNYEKIKNTAFFLFTLIVFPIFIYKGLKHLVSRIFMLCVLPAQNHPRKTLDAYRRNLLHDINATKEDYIVRHVFLEKNAIRYSGILLGHRNTLSNRKWALFSPGNGFAIEYICPYKDENELKKYYLTSFFNAGFNVLLVNPPNVGRSEGQATPENLGHAQEVGLSFLETAIQANKIILVGQSLGGASIGQAINQHTFKPKIKYLVFRLMTFDSLSHIANKLAGFIGKWVVMWLGYEMDSVASSKKLSELKILEVVLQASKDELMKGVELRNHLEKEKITEHKEFYTIPDFFHNDFPNLTDPIKNWDRQTLPSS